jgi:hypothetical protein
VKSAEKGGACIDPPGFDAAKLIKGKKRHALAFLKLASIRLMLRKLCNPC